METHKDKQDADKSNGEVSDNDEDSEESDSEEDGDENSIWETCNSEESGCLTFDTSEEKAGSSDADQNSDKDA